MANIVIFEPNKVPELHESVNTPDFSENPNAVINPDLTSLSSVHKKYWKRSGDIVVEMTTEEKQAVDQAEINKKTTEKENLNIDVITLAKALVAAGVVTKSNLVQAIKSL